MKKLFLTGIALISMLFIYANEKPLVDTLDQYLGKYKFPDGSVVTEVTVTMSNGVLTANSVMGSTELRKTEGDVFEIVAYGGVATFKRNAEGKISGVQIVVGDINIEGTKTEGLALKTAFQYGRLIE